MNQEKSLRVPLVLVICILFTMLLGSLLLLVFVNGFLHGNPNFSYEWLLNLVWVNIFNSVFMYTITIANWRKWPVKPKWILMILTSIALIIVIIYLGMMT